ncbi:MAG: ligand-binding sensor domain-containing protein [Planctomycetota bacterium]|jgi:ligand-binding sensor domain-containing protein
MAVHGTSFGQQRRLAFNQVDTEDGMPASEVLAILPSADGMVWFGTTSGLDQYDGKFVQLALLEANRTLVLELH